MKYQLIFPLRPSSSGKEMGKVCGRLQVQFPMRQKFTYQKKKKEKEIPINFNMLGPILLNWFMHNINSCLVVTI